MHSSKNRIKKKIFFLIVAVLWIIITIIKIPYITITFDDCTSVAEGIIIETKKTRINGSSVYYPVYQINVNGEEYTHVRIYPSNEQNWTNGEKVIIKYNKYSPKEMYSQEEMESYKSGKYGVIIALLFYLIFVVFVGYLAFRS